jgi:inhibitor of cysteine peptidase
MGLSRIRRLLPFLALILSLVLGACGDTATGPTVLPDPDTVVVEQVQVQILESFPVQVHVLARGKLPDACSEIDQVQQSREGNDFTVTLTLARRPNAKCALRATRFEHIIPLDVQGLKAGVYRVTVNGVTGTFELQTDNVLNLGASFETTSRRRE